MRRALVAYFTKVSGTAPAPRVQAKLDEHFGEGNGKRWPRFRQNLRSKKFLEAVRSDGRSDEKLRQYSEMVHLHKTGKGTVFPVKSDHNSKTYGVKYHRDIDRFTCPCEDWTIKHSVDGGDCYHIKKLKSQLSMTKEAGVALRELLGLGRAGLQMYKTEGNREQAWHAGEVGRIRGRIKGERRAHG